MRQEGESLNTSGKGIGYENDVVRHLLSKTDAGFVDYLWAQRSAASHSPFDVHAIRADGRCDHYAVRNVVTFGCVAARHYAESLEPLAWTCHTGVFHKTRDKEFCEH